MTTKHTPGPWYTRHGQISSETSSHGCTLANCNATSKGISDEEVEANAKLMADSPRMLEVLRGCVIAMEMAGLEGEDLEAGRNMLAEHGATEDGEGGGTVYLTVREFFEAHGFRLEETGGNCSAYVRTDGEESHTCVTLQTDPAAPTDWYDPVTVTRTDGGNPLAPCHWESVTALRTEVEANTPGYVL